MGDVAGRRGGTVVLVDDDTLVRTVVRALLEASTSLEVVGEAPDGCRGVDLVDRLRPDAAVIDGQMPCLDGWEAGRILRERHPGILLVMFTGARPNQEAVTPFDAVHYKLEGADTLVDDLVARLRSRG